MAGLSIEQTRAFLTLTFVLNDLVRARTENGSRPTQVELQFFESVLKKFKASVDAVLQKAMDDLEILKNP